MEASLLSKFISVLLAPHLSSHSFPISLLLNCAFRLAVQINLTAPQPQFSSAAVQIHLTAPQARFSSRCCPNPSHCSLPSLLSRWCQLLLARTSHPAAVRIQHTSVQVHAAVKFIHCSPHFTSRCCQNSSHCSSPTLFISLLSQFISAAHPRFSSRFCSNSFHCCPNSSHCSSPAPVISLLSKFISPLLSKCISLVLRSKPFVSHRSSVLASNSCSFSDLPSLVAQLISNPSLLN